MAVEDVSAFLLENVGSPVEEKEVKLKRFANPFKIKSLTVEEITNLRKLATKKFFNKRTSMYETETDNDKFAASVLAKAVVYPDLDNAELQQSWGVHGEPEKLLSRMLSMGEYNKLSQEVMDMAGLNDDNGDELVETAKN